MAVTPVLQRARSIRSRGKSGTFGGVRTYGFRTKYEFNVPLTPGIGVTTFLKCYYLFAPTVCRVQHSDGHTRRDALQRGGPLEDAAKFLKTIKKAIDTFKSTHSEGNEPALRIQKCAMHLNGNGADSHRSVAFGM
jgi:hypothetical protein